MKYTPVLFLLFILLSCQLVQSQPGQWNYIAPNRYYLGGAKTYIGDITFLNADTGYATSQFSHEILKTTNGGTTWLKKPCNVYGYKTQFLTSQIGYINSGYEISKTNNGADNWSLLLDTNQIPSSNAYIWDFQFLNENTGFVAGQNCLLKTVDGGVNWSSIFPSNMDTTWTCIFFINNSVGWAFGGDSSVIKTIDGGISWTSTFLHGKQYYDLIRGARFYDSNTGIAITQGGLIYKTSDGGVIWVKETTTTPNSNLCSVKIYPSGLIYSQAYAGASALSSDTGKTWTTLPFQDGYWSGDFLTETYGFIGSTYQIYKTVDGVNFTSDDQQYQPSFYPISDIDWVDVNHIISIFDNDRTHESFDNGNSWTVDANSYASFVTSVSNNCYFEQFSNDIVRYENGSATLTIPNSYLAIATSKDSIIKYEFITADSLVVSKTTNGGNTWSNIFSVGNVYLYGGEWQSDPLSSNLSVFSRFNDWNIGMVAWFDAQGVSHEFLTIDNGINWKSSLDSTSIISSTKLSPSGQLFCLRGKDVYYSLQKLNSNLDWDFVSMFSIDLIPGDGTADFGWSKDSVLWATLYSSPFGTSFNYSFDDGMSWNSNNSLCSPFSVVKQLSNGKFVAGTIGGELLEYNGDNNNGRIKGNLYYDFNKNNIKDGYDIYAPSYPISCSQSTSTSYTSNSGNFIIPSNQGLSTITPSSTSLFIPNPAYKNITLNTGNDLSINNNFALQPIDSSISDIQIGIIPDINTAPGFDHEIYIYCTNTGVKPVQPTIQLKLGSLLTFNQSNPANSSMNGDTVTWNLPLLYPFQTTAIEINTTISQNAQLDSTLHYSATALPVNTDYTPSNNFDEVNLPILGSFDPNFKEVKPDTIPFNQSQKPSSLSYTIHFQNTGTASAHFVVVKDRLSSLLDPATLRFTAASHPYKYHIEDNNLLVITFDNIMLADSNSNEPESHGFASFIISPKQKVFSTNSISNSADIYFDYNSPVSTNIAKTQFYNDGTTSIKTIDNPKLNIQIYPNPAHTHVNINSEDHFAYQLVDMWGRLIIKGQSINNNTILTTRNLAAGMYFLQITQNGLTQGYQICVTP